MASSEQLLARTHHQEAVVRRVIAAKVADIVVTNVGDSADVVARWHLMLQGLRRTIAGLNGSGYGGYNLAYFWHGMVFFVWLWLA